MDNMIIDLDIPCQRCGSTAGEILPAGLHKKLSCWNCGYYIKMISKKEIENIQPVEHEKDNSVLDEINFKLDLILSHLDIKVGT